MLDTINVLLFSVLIYVFTIPADRSISWQTAKTHIKYETLSYKDPATLYGGCRILPNWTVDLSSCDYYQRDSDELIGKIDMEHIVPAERMRIHSGCGDLNRVDCRKKNVKFKSCHNNKFNIYPAISTINRYRGNAPFTELTPEGSLYPFGLTVGFKKSINGRSVEPPERSKIAVATAYFTMAKENCIKLTDEEVIIFSSWLLKD